MIANTPNISIIERPVCAFFVSITSAVRQFIFLISNDDLALITSNIGLYFDGVKNEKNINILFNSFFNNLSYVMTIWFLGISIIGLPIILVIFGFKMFITGFSISSIIYTYKVNGILKTIIHIFPPQFVFLVILLLITFYAVSFCIKLFKYLFLKKMINFKEVMQRYFKILLISLFVCIVLSFYEAYVSTYLLNLFN